MAYECKVFDKKGKLKKVLRGNETISKEAKSFLARILHEKEMAKTFQAFKIRVM